MKIWFLCFQMKFEIRAYFQQFVVRCTERLARYFIFIAYYMMQKIKGISIINAKLGRDTTTAVSQLQWSQPSLGM